MKLSIKDANKLFQTLVSDVEVVEDKDADKDVDLSTIETEINDNLTAKLTPDIEASAKEAANAATTGKFVNSLRSETARLFNVNKKDLEGKELNEILKIAKSKYDESAGKENQTWQTEREQLIAEHEEAMNKVISDKDAEVVAANNKYMAFHVNQQVQKITEKIPRKKGELSEHADYLLYKAQKDGFEVKYDEEKGKLSFWKDGKEHRDGNKEFDISKYASSVFDKAGILVTDTRHIDPKDVKDGKEKGVSNLEKTPEYTNAPDNLKEMFAEMDNEG